MAGPQKRGRECKRQKRCISLFLFSFLFLCLLFIIVGSFLLVIFIGRVFCVNVFSIIMSAVASVEAA